MSLEVLAERRRALARKVAARVAELEDVGLLRRIETMLEAPTAPPAYRDTGGLGVLVDGWNHAYPVVTPDED